MTALRARPSPSDAERVVRGGGPGGAGASSAVPIAIPRSSLPMLHQTREPAACFHEQRRDQQRRHVRR